MPNLVNCHSWLKIWDDFSFILWIGRSIRQRLSWDPFAKYAQLPIVDVEVNLQYILKENLFVGFDQCFLH